MRVSKTTIAIAATAIAGSVAGICWPPPPLPALDDSDKNWTAVHVSPNGRHSKNDMNAVTSKVRWAGTSAFTGEQKSPWQLKGVTVAPHPGVLISTAQDLKTHKNIGLGEALPDGSILQSVFKDGAETRKNDCITTYKLFQSQPIEKSGTCEGSDDTDQGTSK